MLFTVSKYIPEGLYGFLESEEGVRAFFHLSEFNPGLGGPPPIVGEVVEVGGLEEGGKSLRARGVSRLCKPEILSGTVIRFDPNVGYGFVSVEGSQQFFLHRSEFATNALPRVGMRVSFYAAKPVTGKVPRACYASILDRGTQ